MAEQRVMALPDMGTAGHVELTAAAERWLVHCPAELFGLVCPMEQPPDCWSHADDKNRLVECWAAVQHELQARADQRRTEGGE